MMQQTENKIVEFTFKHEGLKSEYDITYLTNDEISALAVDYVKLRTENFSAEDGLINEMIGKFGQRAAGSSLNSRIAMKVRKLNLEENDGKFEVVSNVLPIMANIYAEAAKNSGLKKEYDQYLANEMAIHKW